MGAMQQGWVNFRKSLAMAGWLYLGKLILSLVFTLPLLAVINATLDNSAYASVLLKTWSLDVILELIHRHEDALPAFVSVLIFYAVAVFLFKQFLNGGIYSTYLRGSAVNVRQFFAESGALFRGNLKIAFFMLFVYFIMALISQAISAAIPSDITGHFGAASFGGTFARIGVLYLFLITASILSDLLRFRLVAFPDQRFFEQLRPAVDFYFRRIVKLNGIYYLYFIPMVLLWLVIEKLALVITGGLANMIGVFLELLLFQICSLARTGQSLLFVATVGPMAQQAFRSGAQDVPSREAVID